MFKLIKNILNITILVLAIVFIVFLVQILTNKNLNIMDAFLIAMALAVAAIPESLPAGGRTGSSAEHRSGRGSGKWFLIRCRSSEPADNVPENWPG